MLWSSMSNLSTAAGPIAGTTEAGKGPVGTIAATRGVQVWAGAAAMVGATGPGTAIAGIGTAAAIITAAGADTTAAAGTAAAGTAVDITVAAISMAAASMAAASTV